jgi:hypothetical protein
VLQRTKDAVAFTRAVTRRKRNQLRVGHLACPAAEIHLAVSGSFGTEDLPEGWVRFQNLRSFFENQDAGGRVFKDAPLDLPLFRAAFGGRVR